MPPTNNEKTPIEQFNELITVATEMAEKSLVPAVQEMLERGTETVGQIVTPIAENPVVRYATKAPGINWLMAALGQVDVETVERETAELRQKYPYETTEQLAQRIILDTTFKAAGAGLVTNIVPPAAVTLLALDIAAVTALQAKMVYHIAALYGFSLHEPTRRGEVLALWGLSTGGSGVLKTGLSLVETIPLIGAGIGIASNAGLLYGLGQIANRFYEAKHAGMIKEMQKQQARQEQASASNSASNGVSESAADL